MSLSPRGNARCLSLFRNESMLDQWAKKAALSSLRAKYAATPNAPVFIGELSARGGLDCWSSPRLFAPHPTPIGRVLRVSYGFLYAAFPVIRSEWGQFESGQKKEAPATRT